MTDDLISIVLPVKDTAAYLSDCLHSIVGQTYRHWELIAVNDGSIDDSLQILNAFALEDDRIQVIDNPKPYLLNALRLGYSKTSGKLIHRMDSDDKMPTYKLEVMFKEWKEHGKGTVITGGTAYFSDEGDVGDGFRKYDAWLRSVARQNTHAENMYRECVIPSNCWLVHRDDFDRVQGFLPDALPEDYDLCFRFYKGGLNIIGLDQVLHFWRDRPDRISRTREEYRDNRFFHLKVPYFMELERDSSRPLVIWGAGRNGKDLVKLICEHSSDIRWVCDNKNKIGKEIYGIQLEQYNTIQELQHPQIIVAVASPDGQLEIEKYLLETGLTIGKDFWFFS